MHTALSRVSEYVRRPVFFWEYEFVTITFNLIDSEPFFFFLEKAYTTFNPTVSKSMHETP